MLYFAVMHISESYVARPSRPWIDWAVGGVVALVAFFIYLQTLAPTVAFLFDDSLEFQLLAQRMAIAHPTGYPLYSIVIKLATFLPFGDVAYRVNLISAVSGALAVLLLYLGGRILTDRFVSGSTIMGEILVRVPALAGALVVALGATFWSQAILAEVYAPQAALTALLLWLALRWGTRQPDASADRAAQAARAPSLIPIAFVAGLALTHHRMSVLLFPALVVYVLTIDRRFLRQPKTLLGLAVAFLVPLLLYLYLPIRGAVTSSLDGAYQNTPAGFINWVLGTAYTVFLTQNPLNEARDASYYLNLWVRDLSLAGLVGVLLGLVALFLRAWREWLLLALALAANLYFALTYRVADIDVFFIPAYVIGGLLLSAGLAGLLWLVYYYAPSRIALAVAAVGAVVLLLVPFALYREHKEAVDLSGKTDVAQYGKSIMAQPLKPNATLIGILGEMSLVRYLQETAGLHPELATIAADLEADRLEKVKAALDAGRAVYLTRPLAGIAEIASLSSVGPLIEVQPKTNRDTPPAPEHALDAAFEDVKLLGYTRGAGAADDGAVGDAHSIPVTLYWQPQKKISNNRLVSLKLVGSNGELAGQIDRQPVLDAYPTTAWRNREYIADAYEVPIFVGAAPGEYTLQVTLYDPASGHVYGQQALAPVTVQAQTADVPATLLGVDQTVFEHLGLELAGYTLDTSEPYAPGAVVPITLLWRMPANGAQGEIELSVRDSFGKTLQVASSTVGGAETVMGQYVRQELGVQLPNDLKSGSYPVEVTSKGGTRLPFQSDTFRLGTVEVQAP